MTRLSRSLALSLLVICASVLVFAPAAVAAPVEWETVTASVHEEQTGAMLIVSGTLPEGTKLPAEVVLSAPTGAQVQWAGEILGGEVSQDPTVEYKVAKKGESDVYTFTLTKSLTGQIEAITPGLMGMVGADRGATVSWVAPVAAKEANVSVRIPQGAKILTPAEGAVMGAGPTGYSYYTMTKQDVKAGDSVDLSFTYSIPAAAAPASGSGGGFAPVVISLVALAFAAIVVVAVRRKSAARVQTEFDEDDDAEDMVPMASEEAVDEEPGLDAELQPEDAPRRSSRAPVILVGAVLIAVVAGAFAASYASAPKAGAGQITKEFSQGEACTTSPFPITLGSGADANAAAEKAFAALASVPSIVRATVYTDSPRIEVSYCNSSASEEQIRAALQPTGLLAE